MQYLTFRMNGVEYAVDVRIVETVVERGETTSVPTPVEYMRGVMDLRGRVVPVIDLRLKLGLPASEDEGRSVVIVFEVAGGERGALKVGALVDGVSEVMTIDEAAVEGALGGESALWERYVRGIARVDGRMIVLVEADALFSLREIEAIRAA
jgi:purine-binding chemotaxis protein CheW